MAAKTQVAQVAEAEAQRKASAREAPVLKSTALEWNSDGFRWREALVRLPDDCILQDLQDAPEIWKVIQ